MVVDNTIKVSLEERCQAEVAYEMLKLAEIAERDEAYSRGLFQGIAYDLRLYR